MRRGAHGPGPACLGRAWIELLRARSPAWIRAFFSFFLSTSIDLSSSVGKDCREGGGDCKVWSGERDRRGAREQRGRDFRERWTEKEGERL